MHPLPRCKESDERIHSADDWPDLCNLEEEEGVGLALAARLGPWIGKSIAGGLRPEAFHPGSRGGGEARGAGS
ncbi:hypothetical protein [Endothiovibrio diazotrophicus]